MNRTIAADDGRTETETETPADRWNDLFTRNRDMVESVDRELQAMSESAVDRGRGIETDGGRDVGDFESVEAAARARVSEPNAETPSRITEDFREYFNASAGYDMTDRENIPFCYVSEDVSTSLINTDEIDSFGVTHLCDYVDVDARLTPGVVEYYDDDKDDVDVYALAVDDDNDTGVYSAARVDAISDFLGVDVESFKVAVWSQTPSDVYLLRVDVRGTPWALILAPYMVPKNATLDVESEYYDDADADADADADGYGPTMKEPVPDVEHRVLPGTDGLEYRALQGTGLAPSDFELLGGKCSPETAVERGYHPDDEWRERNHRLHGEAMARAAVRSKMTDAGVDRGERVVTDGGQVVERDGESDGDGESDDETGRYTEENIAAMNERWEENRKENFPVAVGDTVQLDYTGPGPDPVFTVESIEDWHYIHLSPGGTAYPGDFDGSPFTVIERASGSDDASNDVDRGKGPVTDGGRDMDGGREVPADHEPDEPAEMFDTDRRLRVKHLTGVRFKFSSPTDDDGTEWIEGPTVAIGR